MELTERNKLAIAGALALAMGLVVGVNLDGEDKPTRTATHEAIGNAISGGSAVLPPTDQLNTDVYSVAIKEARDADSNAVDLLTALVAPGAEVTTGVNLPAGTRTTGVLEYLGPTAGDWETISVTHTDSGKWTWVEVKARNAGSVAARLIGLIRVAPP